MFLLRQRYLFDDVDGWMEINGWWWLGIWMDGWVDRLCLGNAKDKMV